MNSSRVRIGLGGIFWAPHTATNRVRGWYGNDDLGVRVPPQELGLVRGDWTSRGQGRGDCRVAQLCKWSGTTGRQQVIREAVHCLREHLYVALASPLAIGDVVQSGPFLHTDGRRNCGVQQSAKVLNSDSPCLSIFDEVPYPLRAWQTSDDKCRKVGIGEFHGRLLKMSLRGMVRQW